MQKGKPLNGMVTQQRGLSTARRVGAALPQHVGVFAGLFGAYLPDAQAKDFCEMEIASAGIVRGFMAVPCELCLAVEAKVSSFWTARSSSTIFRWRSGRLRSDAVPPHRKWRVHGDSPCARHDLFRECLRRGSVYAVGA